MRSTGPIYISVSVEGEASQLCFSKIVFSQKKLREDLKRPIIRIAQAVCFLTFIFLVFILAGVGEWAAKSVTSLGVVIAGLMNFKLITIGKSPITVSTLIYLVVAVILLFQVSERMESWTYKRMLSHSKIAPNVRQSIGSVVRVGLLAVGFMVLLQSVGIDLSSLTVMAGAIGLGLSLGLQGIANNFMSGFIIMMERSIKVGDRIQMGDVFGIVTGISLRATTVVNDDNIAVIIPNSLLTNTSVVNWSGPDEKIVLRFPVLAPNEADPEKTVSIIKEALSQNRRVLHMPEPSIVFNELTTQGLRFTVAVWTTELGKTDELRSELTFALAKMFRSMGSTVQFPQAPTPMSKALPGGSATVVASSSS
jgi:Small-conductance mechanosensitive channel